MKSETRLTFDRFALAAGVWVVAVLTAPAPLGMFAAPAWAALSDSGKLKS